MGKVISVEFKGRGADRLYFFGSKAAVFERFDKSDLGVSYKTLRGINLAESPYENKLCIIRQGELYRKESDRGNHLKRLHDTKL